MMGMRVAPCSGAHHVPLSARAHHVPLLALNQRFEACAFGEHPPLSHSLQPQPAACPTAAESISVSSTRAQLTRHGVQSASAAPGVNFTAMRPVHAAAIAQAAQTDSAPKQQVLDLLSSGHTNVNPKRGMDAALDALIATSDDEDPAAATFELGQGVWEVFNAPHIRSLSSLFLTKFDPIRYTLDNTSLRSSVGYDLPFGLGRGWLNASGFLSRASAMELKLRFDTFWVDRGGAPLRSSLAPGEGQSWDNFITGIGRLAFFENLASFPVLYVDEDLTVFMFPPLGVKIAAQRVE